jgi:hypothetical protein
MLEINRNISCFPFLFDFVEEKINLLHLILGAHFDDGNLLENV